MNKKNEDPFGMASMASMWLNSMNGLMATMSDEWLASQMKAETPDERKNVLSTAKKMRAALKNYEAFTGALATPESMAALLKGGEAMPELLMQMAQSSLVSFLEVQSRMVERFGHIGNTAKAYTFDDLDENIFRFWTETYEKEFRQYFQIPQLGLMRTYQEKANLVADKYNLLQSTYAEFMSLLSLPMKRTLEVMQDKLGEMAETDGLPDDSKEYYNMWVRVLEGHYMNLFQTPEYTETLARTINTLADFSAARNALLEDVLNTLPVARRSEMDDMARELYELKKRVRKLEKERLQQYE